MANNKIVKYPKHVSVNIGYIILLIMFIYVAFHVFSALTKENITIYEVTRGTISSNREYNALALREEEPIVSRENGTVIYIAENYKKVGVKSRVYAVDKTGAITAEMDYSAMDADVFKTGNISKVTSVLNSYILDFSTDNFNRVYSIKTDLSSQVDQLYADSAMRTLSTHIQGAVDSGTFTINYLEKPGVVVYSTDGYETLTDKDLSPALFDTSAVKTINYKSKENVTAGQTIGKIITSDKWKLVIEINDEMKAEFADTEYVHIKFLGDDVSTWCTCEEKEKDGHTYLIIGLDDGVERYADSRFVHIKLLDRSVSGLKIPNSAIVKKQFFAVPKAYFANGSDLDKMGVMIKKKGGDEFFCPDIYKETDDFYYVAPEELPEGTDLIKFGSSEIYTVGSNKTELSGVYNVNKGYTVFKQIDIVYRNEDYSVIESGTKYGVSLYDHIVLQGESVSEDQILN